MEAVISGIHVPFSGPLGQHQPVLGRLKVNLDEQVGLLYF